MFVYHREQEFVLYFSNIYWLLYNASQQYSGSVENSSNMHHYPFCALSAFVLVYLNICRSCISLSLSRSLSTVIQSQYQCYAVYFAQISTHWQPSIHILDVFGFVCMSTWFFIPLCSKMIVRYFVSTSTHSTHTYTPTLQILSEIAFFIVGVMKIWNENACTNNAYTNSSVMGKWSLLYCHWQWSVFNFRKYCVSTDFFFYSHSPPVRRHPFIDTI